MKKRWDVDINGSKHVVELEHGYISGKRIIYVDGHEVLRDRKLIDFGSAHSIIIDDREFIVSINTKGITFKYDLRESTGEGIEELDDSGAIDKKELKKIEENKSVRAAASWFYWIGGLSVVNTLLSFFESNSSFILGLESTLFVDAIAFAIGDPLFYVIGACINLFIAGIFIFLGVHANRMKKWAFIAGMIFYLLDGLILTIAFDFISAAFHIYALYCIYSGYRILVRQHKLTMQE